MKRSADDILALLTDHGVRLHALLFRLTLREHVVEDLMQELFVKLVRSNGFGRAKDPFAYAFRVATNLAFDWRRAQKRAPWMESASDDLPAPDCSPLIDLVRREEMESVLDAMSSLPRLGRDIVVMRYLEQQEYETIARHLAKTAHQVRGLCHKAVARLRNLMDDKLSAERQSGGPQSES